MALKDDPKVIALCDKAATTAVKEERKRVAEALKAIDVPGEFADNDKALVKGFKRGLADAKAAIKT